MKQDHESYYMGRVCKRTNNTNNTQKHLHKHSLPQSIIYNIQPQQQKLSKSFILKYQSSFNQSNQHFSKTSLYKNKKNSVETLMKNQIIKMKISEPKKIINNINKKKNQLTSNKDIFITPYQKMINQKQRMKKFIGQRARKATINNFSHEKKKSTQQRVFKKSYSDLQNYQNQIIQQSQKTKQQITNNQQFLQGFDPQIIIKSLIKKQKDHKYTPQLKMKQNQEGSNINIDSKVISLTKFNKNYDITCKNLSSKIFEPDFHLKRQEKFKPKYYQLKHSKFVHLLQNSKKRPMSGINKYQGFSVILQRNQAYQNELSNFLQSKSISLNQHQKGASRPSTSQKGFSRKKYKVDFLKKQDKKQINNKNQQQSQNWPNSQRNHLIQ